MVISDWGCCHWQLGWQEHSLVIRVGMVLHVSACPIQSVMLLGTFFFFFF